MNFCRFDICIIEIPPPPANDECSQAITIAPTAFMQTKGIPVNIKKMWIEWHGKYEEEYIKLKHLYYIDKIKEYKKKICDAWKNKNI